MSADLLATIVAAAQRIVEVRSEREPLSQLRARIERLADGDRPPRASFAGALSRGDRLNVIAECSAARRQGRAARRIDPSRSPVVMRRGRCRNLDPD